MTENNHRSGAARVSKKSGIKLTTIIYRGDPCQVKTTMKVLTMPEHNLISMALLSFNFTDSGLRDVQLASLEKKFGKNEFSVRKKSNILRTAWDIIREPMFLILLLASALYFVLGETSNGLLMLVSLVFVGAISFYQEVKSSHALAALRQYTQPTVTVIRDGKEQAILSSTLLPGDVFLIQEGDLVPADADILQANDLSVNESILTGESLPVEKNAEAGDRRLFQGTTLNSGKCYARVTAIGNSTELGKLGRSIADIPAAKTELQRQINRFVRIMALAGTIIFLLLWLVNYAHSQQLLESLLLGLTFSMAIIPEEIPVAFSSFMALGAYHMARLGIITRQPLTIENLGAVSVICLDKTGTVTENRMTLKVVYDFELNRSIEIGEEPRQQEPVVLWYGRLASEPTPFDAMEKAIVEAYDRKAAAGVHGAKEIPEMVHEYPLGGHPPMMTHVYPGDALGVQGLIVAGKGAPERILAACRLDSAAADQVRAIIIELASKGYRVLGVCAARWDSHPYPANQDDFDWQFKGLLALYDPPKMEVKQEFTKWRQAGISIKLVTGDFPATAQHIAGMVGLTNLEKVVTGDEVMEGSPAELQTLARSATVFARMFPEAKLKLVEALKASGGIVAMLGDGVNDGPALRSAHIGVAMGGKGTEIARQAADLVLTDDNLGKVTEAIRQGRKIYLNLKKAIRYIVSIHVPIMLIASVPLLLGWKYPNIFTPIHIIFLELIMGPTCSIFFENEPVESGIMDTPPRTRSGGIFTGKELSVSLLQGGIIATGIMILYYYFMNHSYSLEYVRTMVFFTLIMANVFLTFAVRSFDQNILQTLRYRNYLAGYIVAASLFFLLLLAFAPFLRTSFGLTELKLLHYPVCMVVAGVITLSFELYKTYFKKKYEKKDHHPGAY
jgi:Ca2+-transporting ATPase